MALETLFTPGRIGWLELKNRVVKAALLENTAAPDGLPTAATRRLYERWAEGGAGLIVTGFAYVSAPGRSYPAQHGAHTDRVIPAWREITAAVHARDARIVLQLAHGGRQVKSRALGGQQALAPSAAPNFLYFTRARAMTAAEVEQAVRDFGVAAARARAAGFDGVQIHAAHGYLVSSFLSPLTNRRRDRWGGDPARRFAFLEAVYRAVREAAGPDFPVLCKLNVSDFLPGGLKPRESFAAARSLAGLGLDALELSGGVYETALHMCRGDAPPDILDPDRSRLEKLALGAVLAAQGRLVRFREHYFLDYARRLKPALPIPLVLVGGVRRPQAADAVLASGWADYVALGRPLIREPGLPQRWQAGSGAAAACVSCNRCLSAMERGLPLQCYQLSPARRGAP